MSIKCNTNSTVINNSCYQNCDIVNFYENIPPTINCYKKYIGFEDNSGNTNKIIVKKKYSIINNPTIEPTYCDPNVSNYATSNSDLLIHYTFDTDKVSGTTIFNLASNNYNTIVKTGGTTDYSNISKFGNQSLKSRSGGGTTTSSIALTSLNAYSFSLWIYLERTNRHNGRIFQTFPGDNCLYLSGQTLRLYGAGGNVPVTTIPIRIWTHIVLVYNGSNAVVYINGSLNGTYRIRVVVNTNFTLNLGCKNFGSSIDFMDGYIDDFRVYNKILVPSEITNLYNNVSINVNVQGCRNKQTNQISSFICKPNEVMFNSKCYNQCISGYTFNNGFCVQNCPSTITVSDSETCTREIVQKTQTPQLRTITNLSRSTGSFITNRPSNNNIAPSNNIASNNNIAPSNNIASNNNSIAPSNNIASNNNSIAPSNNIALSSIALSSIALSNVPLVQVPPSLLKSIPKTTSNVSTLSKKKK